MRPSGSSPSSQCAVQQPCYAPHYPKGSFLSEYCLQEGPLLGLESSLRRINSAVGPMQEKSTRVEARQLQDSGGLKPRVSDFLV